VIGTLYCAKANYGFGTSRIIKSLEPLSLKLDPDTWFYAKRCLVALADGLAKHTVFVDDKTVQDVVDFLDSVHAQGHNIPSGYGAVDAANRTVSAEAAALKGMFLHFTTLDLQ
jgi:tetratricopeptide repeat protein 30